MEETSGTIYFDLVRSHGSLDKVDVDVVTTAGTAMSHVGAHTRLLRVQEVGPGMGGGRLKKGIGEDRSGKGIGQAPGWALGKNGGRIGKGFRRDQGGTRGGLGKSHGDQAGTRGGLGKSQGGIRQEQGVGWARPMGD